MMTTIRRASLAVLAILVLEYGIGMYVNLYLLPRPAAQANNAATASYPPGAAAAGGTTGAGNSRV
jgi:hypothetical protein